MKRKILLGVTGSIAAYKSAEIASGLTQAGYNVQVVMTASAVKFITPLTLETITKNKVYVDMFIDEDHTQVTHITLATESDLILIAPATYNMIAKTATGIADNLLSAILAAANWDRVIFAPAMNANMYHNPINLQNIEKLQQHGCNFIEPDEGMLACGTTGKGRLKNVPAILEAVEGYFCEKILTNRKVLISAGATREYIDPIRFISNTSTGLMGVSLAKACRNMGADVTLVLANSPLEVNGVKIIRVDTVAQMREEVIREFKNTDYAFAAAAVSDYKPKAYSQSKIKKTGEAMSLEFEENIDILAELGHLKQKQVLIGFAAESDDLFKNARTKLEKKSLDMIIANNLSNFAANDGKVWLITSDKTVELEKRPKEKLAYDIVRTILKVGD
ncbi:MAG: bifunctional phosphopantothenoylcysteine decarboxylase/phosphopantothenate--cysteine ligase CoaBC [Clostridiaceae bacterium]|jgi:phosphopantothenoylcysteine decarboxylase/phosphopantothenate--cysteine ligase|nr:bifunctional phosphopantothenoylcysteine decarboxylase/phosphopantothenate--cysteine ligase CoaBC [Clostridiaceae bacterium]